MSKKSSKTVLYHNFLTPMARLERRQKLFVNRAIGIDGFTGSLYRYILTIHQNPGCNQDFLAEFHFVDKSRVARVARQLEVLKYIYRQADISDRRHYQLYLTAEGEALNGKIRAALEDWGKLITQNIPTADFEMIVNTLQKMFKNSEYWEC